MSHIPRGARDWAMRVWRIASVSARERERRRRDSQTVWLVLVLVCEEEEGRGEGRTPISGLFVPIFIYEWFFSFFDLGWSWA